MFFSRLFYGIRVAISDPSKLYRFISKCSRKGWSKSLKRFFSNSFSSYENTFDLSLKKITILTTPHCYIIAKQIKNTLEKLGFYCYITLDEREMFLSSATSIPIVLAPQMFSKLPKNFIAFQLEQKGSQWFDQNYLSLLKQASFVLEYSKRNLEFLQMSGIPFEKLYYCPIFPNSLSLSDFYDRSEDKEFDLVFYGAMNERRRKILSALKKKYKILELCNTFGQDLYNQINRARLLLNIHFYEDADLETTRLAEAVALGIPIISESSSSDLEEQYEGFVTFAKSGNIEDISKKIEQLLKTENSSSASQKPFVNFSWFDFYLLRFLLAQDLISFKAFTAFFNKNFPKLKDRICLSLPESTERRRNFERQTFSSTFSIFPGLRHSLGWVGCGYSYKFLFNLAISNKVSLLCICEDDVCFPVDMEEKFSKVNKFLQSNSGKWQVFSGIISEVPGNTKILNVVKQENLNFVFTNYSIGLVFSFFSKEALHVLKDWEQNLDINQGTIDKYMGNNLDKFITCVPFLVSQDNSLSSTIWNDSNQDLYDESLKSSYLKLNKKIHEFNCQ